MDPAPQFCELCQARDAIFREELELTERTLEQLVSDLKATSWWTKHRHPRKTKVERSLDKAEAVLARLRALKGATQGIDTGSPAR